MRLLITVWPTNSQTRAELPIDMTTADGMFGEAFFTIPHTVTKSTLWVFFKDYKFNIESLVFPQCGLVYQNRSFFLIFCNKKSLECSDFPWVSQKAKNQCRNISQLFLLSWYSTKDGVGFQPSQHIMQLGPGTFSAQDPLQL